MARHRGPPLLSLRKDVQTPHGVVWTWRTSGHDADRAAHGEAADPERRLAIGDLVKVSADRGRSMNLRVVDRRDGIVRLRRT